MFYNYVLIALHNLRKQPVFSAIKVLSLTLGLVCSIIVILHVQYTYSYDKQFPNWQNIYRLVTSFTTDQRINSSVTADAYVAPLLQDYPQIELGAKILAGNGNFTRGDETSSNDFYWVEPPIVDIFSLQFVRGDGATALADTNTIVLDETTARKYFGDADPIGQILTLDNQTDLRVTAVMRDLPRNTHIQIPMMISAATGQGIFGQNFLNGTTWAGYNGTQAYFVLPNAAEALSINNDLAEFVQRNVPETQRAFVNQIEVTLELEALGDIYLSPRQGFSNGDNSRTQILYGLLVFAMLILLTSCINFTNLSLSQVQQRGKEIGVRKSLGANRSQIIIQFLLESMLLTVLALAIAAPLIYFAIPVYTSLTNTTFTAALLLQTDLVLYLLLFVVFTGLLSGLLPALSLSRFQPATIIKGLGYRGRLSQAARSIITVLQFSFATVLVILAIGISTQVRHLDDMEIGFNRHDLVILDSQFNPRNAEAYNYDALVNDLGQHAGIVSVAKSQTAPPNTGAYNPWRRPSWAPEELRPISHYAVDENYLDTYQIPLLAGRNFSQDFPADYVPAGQPDAEQTYGALITMGAVRNFGFDSPQAALDELLLLGGNLRFRVIGVINDFRLSGGLEDPLRSTSVLRATVQPMRALSIRINPNQLDSALEHIDAVWERHQPGIPINRTFYSETYGQLIYDQTNGINKASLFAAIITITIAALGLYALAFYSSQRRTKEVGVRKVLGATSSSIVGLLAWDFLKPVLASCVVASIVGYYVTNYFFSQFASRASLGWEMYLIVSLATLLIALLTVSVQCYRSASSDPVRSLRYE